jgi:hypothetical protein
LNSNPNSEWDSFFKDNQVLVQIDKDVRRLCPDLFFFQKATEFPCEEIKNASSDGRYESLRKRIATIQLRADQVSKNRLGITIFNPDPVKREEQHEYSYLPDGQEAHWEIVERILFIYAKLNPGCSYIQGMNEICGPIYYTMVNDPDIEWRSKAKRNLHPAASNLKQLSFILFKEYAEADCFFCFNNLMGFEGVRENFDAVLDNSQLGIGFYLKIICQFFYFTNNKAFLHLFF